MDTENKLVITLTSKHFRWGGTQALDIKHAIDGVVNDSVDIRWEINNWDRFSVQEDTENARYHVYDSVRDSYIVDNLKTRDDAARLTYLMNNSFNDTNSLERG